MKTAAERLRKIADSKLPVVVIDPGLNKYNPETLFPEKLALANEQLQGAKLPVRKKSA